MNSDNCARVEPDLKAWVDGETTAVRRLTIGRHVRGCATCRERIREMQTITQKLVGADAAPELTPGLKARLLSSVSVAGNEMPAKLAPLWRRKPGMVLGGGGAVAAASALAFATLYHGTPASDGGETATGKAIARLEVLPAGAGAAPAAAPQITYGTDARDESGSAVGALSRNQKRAYYTTSAAAAKPEPNVTAKASQRTASAPLAMNARFAEAGAPPLTDDGRQVHREASLGVEVTAIEATSDRIEEMVKADGGYVASNNLSTDQEGEKSADLSVRVPTKDFDSMMASFAKLGTVASKNVTGEDITDKTSDATSAEQVLVNEAQETEQKLRFQSMSERRTGQKEAELRQIRIQLAQTRARLGLLRRMASLSTIDIHLSEKQVKAAAPHKSAFWNGMAESNRSAMLAFQAAVRVPLLIGIWVVALSPLWAPLIFAYRWASRKANSR